MKDVEEDERIECASGKVKQEREKNKVEYYLNVCKKNGRDNRRGPVFMVLEALPENQPVDQVQYNKAYGYPENSLPEKRKPEDGYADKDRQENACNGEPAQLDKPAHALDQPGLRGELEGPGTYPPITYSQVPASPESSDESMPLVNHNIPADSLSNQQLQKQFIHVI